MLNPNKKGMVLFIVLGVLLVVTILSVAILEIIASHARLTHHQVTRIQAEYAAKAGLVYALKRLNTPAPPTSTGWQLGVDCLPASPCTITDTFPGVTSVTITLVPGGVTRKGGTDPSVDNAALCIPPTGYSYCVSSTAEYTYTEP